MTCIDQVILPVPVALFAPPAGSFEPIAVRYSGERCCVCDEEGDFDFDQLVCCDLCGLAVHQVGGGGLNGWSGRGVFTGAGQRSGLILGQIAGLCCACALPTAVCPLPPPLLQSCYGVMELPGPDEMWLCRACELKEEGGPAPQVACCCARCGHGMHPLGSWEGETAAAAMMRLTTATPGHAAQALTYIKLSSPARPCNPSRQCCVCPCAGGALKPTTIRGLWCHSACQQWIPEVGG